MAIVLNKSVGNWDFAWKIMTRRGSNNAKKLVTSLMDPKKFEKNLTYDSKKENKDNFHFWLIWKKYEEVMNLLSIFESNLDLSNVEVLDGTSNHSQMMSRLICILSRVGITCALIYISCSPKKLLAN